MKTALNLAAVAENVAERARSNPYMQGYMSAFALFPDSDEADPWEDIRLAYREVGDSLRQALRDDLPRLEQETRGTQNERAARELARNIRQSCE